MSMIDTSNNSIKNSPFKDLSSEGEVPANPFDGISKMKEVRKVYLSSRSSVFLAMLLVALCLMIPPFNGDPKAFLISILINLGTAFGFILFWSFTLRFIENPEIMPLSIAINIVPAAVLGILLNGRVSFTGLILLSAGVSCLSLISSDTAKARKLNRSVPEGFTGIDFLSGEMIKYDEFIKPDITGEILIPSAFAVLAALLSILLTSFINPSSGAGLRILAGSVFLMLESFIVSKISGKDILLTSAKQADASRVPSYERKALRSFILRRSRYIASFVIIGTSCLLSDYINSRFQLNMPYIKHIACVLMIFVFAFIRGRHTKHRIQYAVELGIIYSLGTAYIFTISDLILIGLFSFGADFLITSVLFVHNRRLIVSERSPYIAGMPLELMTVSFIIMICDTVMKYWGIALF